MTKISLEGIELDRLLILQQVKNRQLTQEEAGKRLNISSRQIRRLMKRFISDGIDGITFQHKGGNRAFDEDFKQQVLTVCLRSEYHGFGPTFASEKLKELENLNINRETLRQWMIEQELWKGRSRKKARIHQSRERRPQFGAAHGSPAAPAGGDAAAPAGGDPRPGHHEQRGSGRPDDRRNTRARDADHHFDEILRRDGAASLWFR